MTLLVAGAWIPGGLVRAQQLARVFAAQETSRRRSTHADGCSPMPERAPPRSSHEDRRGIGARGIGDLHFRLANTDQARAAFDEARRLADTDPDAAGRLFGSLGVTELVAGRFDAALADYTESRTRFELAKRPEGVAHAWVGIGFSQAAREKFADAITAYRTAIRMFEEQKQNEEAGRAWLGLSIAQSGLGEQSAALESAQKVRVIADVMKSEDLAWRARVRAGDVLRKLSRPDEARQSFQEAIVALDRLAADLPANPEVRAQLEDSASAGRLALTLAAGRRARALAAVEARRAHMLHPARCVPATSRAGPRRRNVPANRTSSARSSRRARSCGPSARRRTPIPRASSGSSSSSRRSSPGAPISRRGCTPGCRTCSDGAVSLFPLHLSPRNLPAATRAGAAGIDAAAADELNAMTVDAHALLVEHLLTDEELLVVSIAHGEAAPASPARRAPKVRPAARHRVP